MKRPGNYKMIKVRPETHQRLKEQATARGMSLLGYLGALAKGEIRVVLKKS